MTQYNLSNLENKVQGRSETVWSVTRITDGIPCKIKIINRDAREPMPTRAGYAVIQEEGVMQSSYPDTNGKPMPLISIGDLLKDLLAIYAFNEQTW